MSQVNIEGKTFLITGGASGLGALYAEAFLKEGAKKVVILDIAEEKGTATTENLNKTFKDKAIFIKCDVSNEADIELAFRKVVEEFKRIDVIINNAGVMNDGPKGWMTTCDVNWRAVVSFTLKGLEHMRKDEDGAGGTIINISSTGAITKVGAVPIYCGSKIAVLHFSQSLAVKPFYKNTGIRILTILPGPTETDMMENLAERGYDKLSSQNLGEFSTVVVKQKAESAVAALVKLFKEGSNGAAWMVNLDRPPVDLKPTLDKMYNEFQQLKNL